ncbi:MULTISPECIES: sulfur carrier protein ThiS [Nocardiopsis]|uniref:Sulfur carrier protein n=1 Tax=Nocardiopsis sinuspersici TaxID=501010 RepID=A0A1V3C1L9_9ACTN|nr:MULTISPECIES: sulfur carrier protein ThiS [Nocardiopsis]NYH50873.1 sulfur carrier protein [Nocardiopsis sinuspersici]OOC54694.1 thiamine biosynthesis protein ThiS [Nocardiopsis sinuspersici]
MELIINGDRREVTDDTTVEAVVRDLTAAANGEIPGGIAVAVNDEVVRRAAWSDNALGAGDRVDVLTAVQGG